MEGCHGDDAGFNRYRGEEKKDGGRRNKRVGRELKKQRGGKQKKKQENKRK